MISALTVSWKVPIQEVTMRASIKNATICPRLWIKCRVRLIYFFIYVFVIEILGTYTITGIANKSKY